MRFLLLMLLSLPCHAQEQECWEFMSNVIACDGRDYGAEFGWNLPAKIPSWVPSPLPIISMHLTYFEYAALPAGVYGAISANTDPGQEWRNAGCSPQNQTCSISKGADLGKLFIRQAVPQPYAVFNFNPPVILHSGDGLVLDQNCRGGGQVQAVWDFCWVKQ